MDKEERWLEDNNDKKETMARKLGGKQRETPKERDTRRIKQERSRYDAKVYSDLPVKVRNKIK